MKKLLATLAVSALAAPAAAQAQTPTPTPADKQNASQLCKQLRTSSGSAANFRSAVITLTKSTESKVSESNAFGKCVSFMAKDEAMERTSAQKAAVTACKAEREAADTPAEQQAFAQKHGAKTTSSAYGKCVSQAAKAEKAEADAADEDRTNAAKQCKTLQGQDTQPGKSFAGFKNFGACVSAKAKEITAARKAEQQQQQA
jgi:hypothetical protein